MTTLLTRSSMTVNKSSTMKSDDFTCKYCGKVFRKITTLSVHTCELKRRWLQENETGVRLGFYAFCRFFELTQHKSTKLYADFVASPYYSAFVKFGQYLVQIRPINLSKFVDWVIHNNIKLDSWTKDEHYHKFVIEYVPKEVFDEALERTLKEMQQWADTNNKQLSDFFRENSVANVCSLITEGRISPWVIFNCKSGHDFLEQLHPTQLTALIQYLNPDTWSARFNRNVEDVNMLKSILKESNL
jgi:hypothetical protein